ncbi:MAG: ABC transporter ATP-binding protein [Deltaproteobacteria bacterium]|nr:MAG: ABC transporter ATP-binding protein [Deltaproteobacteria bacterium]
MAPALLDMDGVHKTFRAPGPILRALSLGRLHRGDVRALRGVHARVDAGEIVGLLGPNGSGKTTLVRCAAGLVRPDTGEVRTLGLDPALGEGGVRGRIGLVLRDDRSFAWRLTGRENLRFFGQLQGLSAGVLAERIEDTLQATRLESVADRPVRTWSTGMRQRLAVCRALLGNPSLLLMDEASSGLDPGRRDTFYTFLSTVVEERNIGILYATHDLTEAQYLCTRVLLLDEGAVAAEGSWLNVEPVAEALFRRAGGQA